MVPYLTRTTDTSLSCNSANSTTTGVLHGNTDDDCLTLRIAHIPKEGDVSLPLLEDMPKFDRVMKMRNTDSRPVKYSTWKPVRMYNGRDNIGTRNFKKLN